MFDRPRSFPGLALALLFVSLGTLCAQDDDSSELSFVPPPVEGVISLGAYDSKGKLVRVLKKDAEIDSFKAASDGLVIDWDRNDSQGKPVPDGKYFARGVLVGDVKIEGVAFHLNDWVDASTDQRIRKVLSATLLDAQRTVVLADASKPEAVVLESNGNRSNTIPLAFYPATVKAAGANLLLFDNKEVVLIDLASGAQVSRQSFSDIRDADSSGVRTVVLSGSQIKFQNQLNAAPQDLKPPADNLFRCAVSNSSIVVASKEAHLWKLDGEQFVPVDVGDAGELLDMGAGASDTVWLLIKTDTATLLKQIEASGQIRREIELPPDLQAVTRLGLSRADDALLLISDDGTTQRVIGLRFQAADQGKSIWEKWFERSLTPFKFFDLKEGKVVATDTKTDSPPVSVKPANNPMENSRQSLFQLSVVTDETGAWVASVDGLPLFQVCETRNIRQARWISDGANGLRVYTSDGTVVEEYHLTSLENLFRFDAGSFD